jgi:hypothetical protein
MDICMVLDLLTLSECSHPRKEVRLESEVLKHIMEIADAKGIIYTSNKAV